MDHRSAYSKASPGTRRRIRKEFSGNESVRSYSSVSSVAVNSSKLYDLAKWQKLARGLWFSLVVESNPQANKQSINGFLDALEWVLAGEIEMREFEKLFDAWSGGEERDSLGLGTARLAWYIITESDVLVSYDSFRDILIKRKCEVWNLEKFGQVLLSQVNRKELKKGYFSEQWLQLIDGLFHSLDTKKSGLITVDDIIFLCLAQSPEKYSLYNDRRQQVEQGLSRLSKAKDGNNDWQFRTDLTTEVLLKLENDACEQLKAFGARDTPVGSPYRGLVTLFVFKQQIKRMSSKHSKDNTFNEFKIQQMMAKLYSLKDALTQKAEEAAESASVRRHSRSIRRIEPFNLWEDAIILNTVGSNEESIKLCLFLCHNGSIIRWAKNELEQTWRSKTQIHHLWIHFKDEKQIFSSSVSDTLFSQLENTVNSYVNILLTRALVKTRSEASIEPQVYTPARRSQFDYAVDDAVSVGRMSSRTTNTYNNFNPNLVNELQKMNFSQPSYSQQVPKSYQKEIIQSSFAKDFNSATLVDNVIISGQYFDVLNKLGEEAANIKPATGVYSDVDFTQTVQNLVDQSGNPEFLLNRSSLKNGSENESVEQYIEKVVKSYESLNDRSKGDEMSDLIIHAEKVMFKVEADKWEEHELSLWVSKGLNNSKSFEKFIIKVSGFAEEHSLCEAIVRPVMVSNYDNFKQFSNRFSLTAGGKRLEFSCSDSARQTYLIRLLCFGISTSRTNILLERQFSQQGHQMSFRTERQFDDFSEYPHDNNSSVGDYDFDAKSVRSVRSSGVKSVQPNVVNVPRRAPPVSPGLSRTESNGPEDSKLALDRISEAAELLRQALSK